MYIKFIPNFSNIRQLTWKVWTTVHLCPYIQYNFQCNDFHTTHTQYIFVDISCTKCWLRQKCKKCGQNFTHNKYSMAFTAPIFIKFTTTQCTNLLHWSVSKRVKKNGERNINKVSFKPIKYAFHQSIFMKLTPAQWHYVALF